MTTCYLSLGPSVTHVLLVWLHPLMSVLNSLPLDSLLNILTVLSLSLSFHSSAVLIIIRHFNTTRPIDELIQDIHTATVKSTTSTNQNSGSRSLATTTRIATAKKPSTSSSSSSADSASSLPPQSTGDVLEDISNSDNTGRKSVRRPSRPKIDTENHDVSHYAPQTPKAPTKAPSTPRTTRSRRL